MLIIFFISLNIFLAAGIALAINRWLQSPSFHADVTVLKNGFRAGLEKCGFFSHRSPYPVELYIWVTAQDKNVCDDCLRRSRLRPMDIADWMKIGLPQTQEARTCCGGACRCQMVLYKKTYSHRN